MSWGTQNTVTRIIIGTMQNRYSRSEEIVCNDMCSVEAEEARGTTNSGAVIKYQQEVTHTTTALFISLKQML